MIRLLVLRPEPGASETVQRARTMGLNAVSIPLFEIVPVPWTAPDPAAFDALLVTSANAIRAGGEQLQRLTTLPVHAVGEATAEAARQAGFAVATAGDGDVDRLLGSIAPNMRLLHLGGVHRTLPTAASQAITAIAVYEAAELEQPDLSHAEGAVALLHSRRAAGRFADLADEGAFDRSTVAIAAISPATLDAAGSGWRHAEAADEPTDSALLALAAQLCNNAPRS